MDAASNTFRVRAELANADAALPSGLRCKAELDEPAKPVVSVAPRAGPTADAKRSGLSDVQTVSLKVDPALATAATLESVRLRHQQASAVLRLQQ
jgi:hypothetical protein